MKPRRVQIKRAKGYRTPPNTRRVCRPSRYGNPFKIGDMVVMHHNGETVIRRSLDRNDAVNLYRFWAHEVLRHDPEFFEPLRGLNVGCYCRLTERCHGDVVLELANR